MLLLLTFFMEDNINNDKYDIKYDIKYGKLCCDLMNHTFSVIITIL